MNPFTAVFDLVLGLVSRITNGDKMFQIVEHLFANLPVAVLAIKSWTAEATPEKIDAILKGIDLRTGTDPGALSIIGSLPPEQEERLSDALMTATEILVKHRLKLPGFVNPDTTLEAHIDTD